MVAFGAASAANRGFGGGTEIFAAMPGIVIGIISLFGVALTQNGRATVDSAEYGQQMLKVARDQLEVSKQSLKQGNGLENSFADLAKRLSATSETGTTETGANGVSYADQLSPIATTASNPVMPEKPIVTDDTLTYRGQTATLIEHKWHLNGIGFSSQEKLIEYIDNFRKQPIAKPLLKAER